MKVKQIMTPNVIRIGAEEPVEAAARMLAHYNVGMLPVCRQDGSLCGVITDRDVVTRCLASNGDAASMPVSAVMTGKVLAARPDMDVSAAAHLMGREQVRRLPVVENGQLCGMLSLGDLANCQQSAYDAADVLSEITANPSVRD